MSQCLSSSCIYSRWWWCVRLSAGILLKSCLRPTIGSPHSLTQSALQSLCEWMLDSLKQQAALCFFHPGVVKGHRKESGELYYSIEKEGQRKWYKRMAVILSLEQGNRLREQYGLGPYEAVTPLTKAADISLGKTFASRTTASGPLPCLWEQWFLDQ